MYIYYDMYINMSISIPLLVKIISYIENNDLLRINHNIQ